MYNFVRFLNQIKHDLSVVCFIGYDFILQWKQIQRQILLFPLFIARVVSLRLDRF